MPRQSKPLTDTLIKQSKPLEKQYKLTDGGGLHLAVMPTGSKLWRMKYMRPNGKEGLLSFGAYPGVSLAKARELRDKARQEIAEGNDPQIIKQKVKAAAAFSSDNTFESVAREWFEAHLSKQSESHRTRTIRRLEVDIFPFLGKRPISDITSDDILACLKRIERRGAIETMQRVKWACSRIFDFAPETLVQNNPTRRLKDRLATAKTKPFSAITTPKEVGALLRAIDGLQGASLVVYCALRLLPLVFVRPGELRHAEWAEIDLDKAEWRICAEKMKSKSIHIVPLSRQAVAILREIQPLTGHGKYVFPSERTRDRPMSDNTINAALRRLGYTKEEHTGHGFRKTASTLLNESQKWHPDAIERQLAHDERNDVRAAYNYAEHLAERIRMMQWWADYLDELKAGARVFELKQA